MAALNDLVTPSLTFEEILSDGSTLSNPAADGRRLFLGEDGLFHMKDSAGTVTDVGGDAAAHIADASDAHDASAISFTPNGSIAATDVQAAIQEVRDEAAGGGGLTYQEALLGANVTMTTAGTWYDGPAVTLSVGTWLVISTLNGALPAAVANATAKLWDGTTVYATAQGTGNSGWSWRTNMQAVVVVAAGTPTLKASATGTTNGGTINAATVSNGAGNNASIITAVKIA